MYCEFFGLKTLPFNNTPDPRFFFNTPDHEEALASLLYAAQERKGFVLVTGEIGSGKTLLSRMLVNSLGSSARTAVISNTRLTGRELLWALCREFGLHVDDHASAGELSRLLEEFLLEQYTRDRVAVVVLDEAQNLPMETFEELRMLSNLEADDAKLLQILMLGQPELQEAFRHPSMRQLHQRIFRTFHLGALSESYTIGYIRHRLAIAGLPEGAEIFTEDALHTIYHHSEGIPRLINQICDNALLAAYTESTERIGAGLIDEVVEQMMALHASTARNAPQGPLARKLLNSAEAPAEPLAAAPPRREPRRHEPAPPADAETPPRLFDRPPPTVVASADLSAELEAVRAIRQQAAYMLHHTTLETQQAETRMRSLQNEVQHSTQRVQDQLKSLLADARSETAAINQQFRQMLDEARHSTERMQQQAAEKLSETQKQTAELREQIRTLLMEVRDGAATLPQTWSAELEQHSQAELEAARQMRQQATDTLKEITAAAHAARQVLSDMQAQASLHQDHARTLMTQEQTELESARQLRHQAADALKEAGRLTAALEEKASATMAEAERHAAATREQAARLLDEVRAQVEAESRRAAETIQREQDRAQAASRQINELIEQARQRYEQVNAQGGEMLGRVEQQTRLLSEQLRDLRERARAGADEQNAALESFMQQLRRRVEESHRQLLDMASAAQLEFQATRQSLVTTREQILAEAEAGRARTNDLLEQVQELLVRTREQSASLLAGLEARVTEQTENATKFCHSAIADGVRTLSDLQHKLEETRLLTDRSRAELETLVRQAAQELAGTREALQTDLQAHKTEIAALSTSAAGLKADIARRFEEARRELEPTVEKHRQNLRQQVIKLIGETGDYIAGAEGRGARIIEALEAELKSAAETADRIYSGLQQSVAMVQERAEDCQDRHQAEIQKYQEQLAGLAERNHRLLAEAQARVEQISAQAETAARHFAARVDELRESIRAGVAGGSEELNACLREALAGAEKIRHDAAAVASVLSERMSRTQAQAEAVLGNAEQAVLILRDQSKAALAEVRSGLNQMTQRADQIQRDLVDTGDTLGDAARAALQQLQQTAAGVTEHLESLRAAAQQDAQANYERLLALRRQLENDADQIRRNAAGLLDQVQARTASLLTSANELLAQAQSGSERIGEQASSLLLQAHQAAERFREQAETLLRRAEATADTIRGEVQTLHGEVRVNAERFQEQISGSRQEMLRAKEDTAEALAQAQTLRDQTRQEMETILRKAEEVTEQTRQLLTMPKALLDEANSRAAALAQLSTKVSTTVKQLSGISANAEEKTAALAEAGLSADEKLEQLKHHTARVGQLVGIIRQLYGTMDARIERLRTRLSQADSLFRHVPQEIEGLRQALAEEARAAAETVEPPIAQASAPAIPARPAGPQPRPATRAGAPTRPPAAPPPAVTPAAPANTRDTLGERVRRSQKLNEWLREVLGEDGIKSTETPAPPKQRAARPAPTPAGK